MKPAPALALAAVSALLALFAAQYALSQMTSGSKTAVPRRPLPPGMKAPVVHFEDLAEKAGLTGINVSGSDVQQTYIVENTGTGVAIFDYDNDGLPDLFFVNGDRFDPNAPKPTHFLYHNLGNLRFEDVTAKSGITHNDWGQGVCAGDIDDDGYVDLFVTAWGHNTLWHNQGNGTFRDETQQRGLAGPTRWSTGCAFFDYDRDGHLDLLVAHYLQFDPAHTPKPGDPGQCMWLGFPVVCGPMGLPPETVSLYHNDGHGHFTEVTGPAGLGAARAAGLTVLTGDFGNTGWPDVFVAADSTPSLLFHNNRDGTFTESGALVGVAYNEDGHEQSGMGASAADYDHDGWLDIVKTNFSGDIPNLYRNLGKVGFTEVTAQAGLAVHTQYVSWGIGFLDFDNDGWKDIVIANGHVYPDLDRRGVGQTFQQPRLLYWNRRDGQFFDVSDDAGPGIAARHSSRGLAVGDLDNDGDVEVVVVNMFQHPSLLKNYGDHGNSLLVRVLTPSGRDAIGARLALTTSLGTQIDEVRSGGYYISQGDFRIHFGLGADTRGDLAVRWPDGSSSAYPGLAAGHWFTIQQGRGIVRAQQFTPRPSPAR
ncbi:MAG: CRTAC1 family protein [Bryobacteraceae bacterium]